MALGLRERKKLATRQALAAAALHLAAERGADAVTVEDIAAAADVSPRTFFNHFATKEEAFVADDLDRAKELLERLRQEPLEADLWGTLVRMLAEHLDEAVYLDRRQALALHAIRTSPAVLTQQFLQYAGLEVDLVAEIARRTHEPASGLQPRLLAASLVAALRTAVDTWIELSEDPTPRRLFETAAAQLAPAFPTKKS
ncbi:MAG: transcriptional regulator TetR family [Frankiales bacterium]|nr:transcriptional regulator TetR family [Frankiales bacterium]